MQREGAAQGEAVDIAGQEHGLLRGIGPVQRAHGELGPALGLAENIAPAFKPAHGNGHIGTERMHGGEARFAHGRTLGKNGLHLLNERSIFLSPWVRAAAEGIGHAHKAGFVSVIDRGHAGQRADKTQGGEIARLAQSVLLIGKVQRLSLLARGFQVRNSSQNGDGARLIVAAQQVHTGIEELGRIILALGFERAFKGAGIDMAQHKAQNGVAHRVVHTAVQRIARAVIAQHAVGFLAGSVLPDLAEDESFGLGGFGAFAQLAQKLHGQLVGHVETPAGGTVLEPMGDDRVFAAEDVLYIGRVGLIDVGQGIKAPPAVVLVGPFVEPVPAGVGRILFGIGAYAAVAAVAVKIHAVGPGMGEHAVQKDADAQLFRLDAEGDEVFLCAEGRVDLHIAAGIVFMVGARLEDGVEVDQFHAQAFDVGQLLRDSLEIAAEEIGRGAVCPADLHFRVVEPVFVVPAVRMEAFLRVLFAGGEEAVRKDLIEGCAVGPVRGFEAGIVHGDLEGRRLVHGRAALAAEIVARIAVEAGAAGLILQDEIIPVHACGGGQSDLRFKGVCAAGHFVALFVVFKPAAHERGGETLVRLNAQTHFGARGTGAKGISVIRISGVVIQCHYSSSGLRCQIFSLYSAMERSEANTPEEAVLRTAMAHHLSGFFQVFIISFCARR